MDADWFCTSPQGAARRVRSVGFAWIFLAALGCGAGIRSGRTAEGPVASPSWSCKIQIPNQRAGLPTNPAVSSLGIKKLIYFRVRFADDREDPVSTDDATLDLTEANAIFKRNSDGRLGLTWEVSPVLQLAEERTAFTGPGGFDHFLGAVREAGQSVGIDYRVYDLDVARHSGVPGFAGGNANLGTRGAQVQAGGAVLLSHELGHNLGLLHANAWMTGNPGISLGSPPLPSNFESLPDPRSVPVYPDSRMGHETVTGPGRSAEYGDTFDIMGSGPEEFSALNRHALGWLETRDLAVLGSGWHEVRLKRLDGNTNAALPRAIRIEPAISSPLGERQYWIQFAPLDPEGVASPGLLIRWADPLQPGLGSLILAPLAPEMPFDGGVTLTEGRTFSDPENGVHVTLRRLTGAGALQTADALVAVGLETANQVPHLALDAPPASAAVNQTVTLTARALDSDGDTLAWHWDFGDGTSSAESGTVMKSWRRDGDFLVTLEVTDGKGGVARATAAIRVGTSDTRRISGRVLDPAGNPVSGIRVHNGVARPEGDGRLRATAVTDAEGRYLLTGLVPGTYTNGAFGLGYTVTRVAPIDVAASEVSNFDFLATPIARVEVVAAPEISESAGNTNLFVIRRTGSTATPLTVFYRLGGTAFAGSDYARPLVDRVVIPAGAAEITMGLDLFDDQVAEDDETIRLDLQAPTQATRLDSQGNLVTVYYPGWEYLGVDGLMQWVLTEPAYMPAADSRNTVVVRDNDEAKDSIVSVASSDVVAVEEPRVESAFRITRKGSTDRALEVFLRWGGSALSGMDYLELPDLVTFGAGEGEHTLVVHPVADGVEEPEEIVELRLVSRPEYAIETGFAVVRLRDSGEVPLRLAARQRADGLLELTLTGKPGSRVILDRRVDFLSWTPIRTNFLFNSDTATVLQSPEVGAAGFFRTRIEDNGTMLTPR
jgi:hypothetical protein